MKSLGSLGFCLTSNIYASRLSSSDVDKIRYSGNVSILPREKIADNLMDFYRNIGGVSIPVFIDNLTF